MNNRPHSHAKTPYCTHCGSSLVEGSLFCRQCGRRAAPVGDAPAEVRSVRTVPVTVVEQPPTTPLLPARESVSAANKPADSSTPSEPATQRPCPCCGSPSPATPTLRLRLVQKNGAEQLVELDKESVLIGSDESCDLRVENDAYVSRKHARVRRENGLLFVDDLGSSNGTQVRIRRSIILEADDELIVGTSIVRLEVQERP